MAVIVSFTVLLLRMIAILYEIYFLLESSASVYMSSSKSKNKMNYCMQMLKDNIYETPVREHLTCEDAKQTALTASEAY